MNALRTWRARVIVLIGAVVFCCGAVPAVAWAEGAQWTVSAVSRPTNFKVGGDTGGDSYEVLVTNTGSGASEGPVSIIDELPAGLENAPGATGEDELLEAAGGVAATEGKFSKDCALTGEGNMACTYSGTVQPGDTLIVDFPVHVDAAEPEGVTNTVRVVGGGAAGASMQTPTQISESPAGFGISPGGATSALSTLQAGGHPNLTVSAAFNTTEASGGTAGNLKNTSYLLPAGFAGDLVDTPTCAPDDFLREECPVPTQVGVTTIITVGSLTGPQLKPVYNLAPEPGQVAKLGFFVGQFRYVGDISVIPAGSPGEYGLQTTFYNSTAGTIDVDNVSLTVWGSPGAAIHDPLRWHPEGSNGHFGETDNATEVPYFTNPTACSGPLQAQFKVTSWQNPAESESPPPTYMQLGEMGGCDRLLMEPALTAEVTSDAASVPTGFDLATEIPQTYTNASALATSALKREVVTLPEGMTVNPSAGAGLVGCSEAQYAEEAEQYVPGHGCPNESKLATVRIKTPSVSEEVTGSVFLAEPAPFGEPGKNPFGSLLALYLVARAPDRGILVKAPGEISLNQTNGQLTTSFDDLPPLPFSIATFSFNQGANAPLVTPPTCGNYTVQAQLTPWSNPGKTIAPSIPAFPITAGCLAGTPPFAPQVQAGTENNNAGAYSPLDIRISRNDDEQEITGFSTQLPLGLTGDLTGIPFCPEADIQLARGKTGAQEEAEPSCPQASEIGYSLAGAGVGTVLVQAPGKLYLGGPFEGAPFSVISITSAHVGPFDLGTVVVHLPLEINPETAQVTIPTGPADQIPHIIKGVVIHLREIRVYVNRNKFMINPTNCNPLAFSATIIGSGSSFENPADDVPVSVSDPFRVTACQALKFSPTLSVSAAGHASKANGTSVTFKITYPKEALGSQSWFNEAKFDLPKQIPARLSTIQKACLAKTFEANPNNCPAPSVIGHAVVHTQILPVPLEGSVYFVSYGSAKFPDAVLLLKGYGITIELHGETFIDNKTGITSATFRSLPDVPFETIEVTLPSGPYSEFGANLPEKAHYNLCGHKLTMPYAFKAANGTTTTGKTTPVTTTGCTKTTKHTTKKHHKKTRHKHK